MNRGSRPARVKVHECPSCKTMRFVPFRCGQCLLNSAPAEC
jgi:hypothetical protein